MDEVNGYNGDIKYSKHNMFGNLKLLKIIIVIVTIISWQQHDIILLQSYKNDYIYISTISPTTGPIGLLLKSDGDDDA